MYNNHVQKAYLFYLHEPFFEDMAVFNGHFKEIYQPLLRLIKTKNDFKSSIAMSLSFLDLMERSGHAEWIRDVKELVERGKVELVCTTAYNPDLKKLSKDQIAEQIILNEYALAYYFGQRQGFEGDDAYMIKDVKGIVIDSSNYDSKINSVLEELSYEWVAVLNTHVRTTGSVGRLQLVGLSEQNSVYEIINVSKLDENSINKIASLLNDEVSNNTYNITTFDETISNQLLKGVSFVHVSEYVRVNKVSNKQLANEESGVDGEKVNSSVKDAVIYSNEVNNIISAYDSVLNELLSYKVLNKQNIIDFNEQYPIWKLKQSNDVNMKEEVYCYLKSIDIFYKLQASDILGHYDFDVSSDIEPTLIHTVYKIIPLYEEFIKLIEDASADQLQKKLDDLKDLLNHTAA